MWRAFPFSDHTSYVIRRGLRESQCGSVWPGQARLEPAVHTSTHVRTIYIRMYIWLYCMYGSDRVLVSTYICSLCIMLLLLLYYWWWRCISGRSLVCTNLKAATDYGRHRWTRRRKHRPHNLKTTTPKTVSTTAGESSPNRWACRIPHCKREVRGISERKGKINNKQE